MRLTKKTRQKPVWRDFWTKFAQVYWEKKPVVLKGVAAPILEIDQDHIFQLLVRYSVLCRKKSTVEGIKFYVDGQPLYADEILKILPKKEDKSLEKYHRRVSKVYSDYCLVCDELLQVSHEKWGVLSAFMENLYQEIGIPNRFSELGLYLGNYRKTPFGVHVDRCGVLSIPVVGNKKFRLWDGKYVEKNPELAESFSYDTFKNRSTLLEVRPGDISYWPSSYWHIAESDGTFSTTWSIGVWVDKSYSEVLMEALKPLLSQALQSEAGTSSIPFQQIQRGDGFVERLPEILNRSVSMVMRLSEKELHDTFLRFWIQFASKRGFKTAPLLQSGATLHRRDKVRGKFLQPILWTRLLSGNLCVAINGILIEVPYSSKVAELVAAINSGEICSVEDSPEILLKIYQAQGIEKVSE